MSCIVIGKVTPRRPVTISMILSRSPSTRRIQLPFTVGAELLEAGLTTALLVSGSTVPLAQTTGATGTATDHQTTASAASPSSEFANSPEMSGTTTTEQNYGTLCKPSAVAPAAGGTVLISGANSFTEAQALRRMKTVNGLHKDQNSIWQAEATTERTEDSTAGLGAAIGAVVGSGIGLLTGIGVMAIPGVAPVTAAGGFGSNARRVSGWCGSKRLGLVGSLSRVRFQARQRCRDSAC